VEFRVLRITSSLRTDLGVADLSGSCGGCCSPSANGTLSEIAGPAGSQVPLRLPAWPHCGRSAGAPSGGALDRRTLFCVFCTEALTCLSQSTQFATKHGTKQTRKEQGEGEDLGRALLLSLCITAKYDHSIQEAQMTARCFALPKTREDKSNEVPYLILSAFSLCFI